VQEITSAYDDLDKRLALYVGLGSLILVSLFNVVLDAPLQSFLLRGLLALVGFSLAGYWYGSFLKSIMKREYAEMPVAEGVERTLVNARGVEGIDAAATAAANQQVPLAEAPAAAATGSGIDLTLPEQEPMNPGLAYAARDASFAAEMAQGPQAQAPQQA
jgi:hypothetical protein